MALDQDSILGSCYIGVDDFKERADAFGCSRALTALNDTSDVNLTAILASASRKVKAYCGRGFELQPIQEDQRWELKTRRVYPYQPPIVSLLSYQIQTAPGVYQNITLAPTMSDASGNIVSYGAVVYDKDRNYLELASLAVLTSLTPVLVSLGISEPMVRYKYTSYATIPDDIAVATGLIAGAMVNTAYRNRVLVPGIQSIETGDQSITAMQNVISSNFIMPQEAEQILRGYQTLRFA